MKSQACRDNVDDMFMVTAALAKYSASWTYVTATREMSYHLQFLAQLGCLMPSP